MRGSIVKKGNKYYIVLDVYDASGKRKRKWYSGFDKKSDAEKALPELLKKAQAGLLLEPQKMTLGEFLQEWLWTQCEPRLSKTTLEGYKLHVEKYIVPALGKIPLQKLHPMQLNKFFSNLLQEGRLSSTTVRNIYRTLSSALNYAARMQLIERNPLQFVNCPKKQKTPGKALELEDLIQIMQAARGTEFEVPIHLAAALGLRRGEILGLRWSDVNLQKGYLEIRRALARVPGEIFFKEPKTEESQRKMYLPDGLIVLLKAHRKKQMEIKLFLGPEYKDYSLVVCRQNGEPWNPSTFTKRFQEFIEKNNLPRIRFHDLRHTNSTLLMGYGKLSPKIVADWLGHSTTAITEEVYTHVNDAMKKEAADIIERLLYKKMENNGSVEIR
jgi:integrase